jgi:hypothetical protein
MTTIIRAGRTFRGTQDVCGKTGAGQYDSGALPRYGPVTVLWQVGRDHPPARPVLNQLRVHPRRSGDGE